MTYFLGVCISEGVVEMDIWSLTFVEKFHVMFKVCVRTDWRLEGVSQVWTGMDREGGGGRALRNCGDENFGAITTWKVSKYGVISGPNTGKYGPEITPYLDTFHAVYVIYYIGRSWKSNTLWIVSTLLEVFTYSQVVNQFKTP